MGLLDEAIREHLELKRQHGASEDDVARQEAEALGPVLDEDLSPEGSGDAEGEPDAEWPFERVVGDDAAADREGRSFEWSDAAAEGEDVTSVVPPGGSEVEGRSRLDPGEPAARDAEPVEGDDGLEGPSSREPRRGPPTEILPPPVPEERANEGADDPDEDPATSVSREPEVDRPPEPPVDAEPVDPEPVEPAPVEPEPLGAEDEQPSLGRSSDLLAGDEPRALGDDALAPPVADAESEEARESFEPLAHEPPAADATAVPEPDPAAEQSRAAAPSTPPEEPLDPGPATQTWSVEDDPGLGPPPVDERPALERPHDAEEAPLESLRDAEGDPPEPHEPDPLDPQEPDEPPLDPLEEPPPREPPPPARGFFEEPERDDPLWREERPPPDPDFEN